jgi:hypothetical protein
MVGSAAVQPLQSQDSPIIWLAIARSTAYLVNSLDENGMFEYIINLNPAIAVKPQYNMLRHAGAIYSLAMVDTLHADQQVRDTMQQAGRFLQEAIAPIPDDSSINAIWSKPEITHAKQPLQAKLGGTGLGLLALMRIEQIVPGFTPLDTLQKLGKFLAYMQKADGSFYSKYTPAHGGREDEWESLYYPGEAALGLAMLYQKDPQPLWIETAAKALAYLAHKRKGERNIPNDHWALLATEQVLAIAETTPLPVPTDLLVNHAIQICEAVVSKQVKSFDRPILLGCFVKDGRTTPSATSLEGLLAALNFLPQDTPLWHRIASSVRRGMQFLLRAQITEPPFIGAIPGAISPLPDNATNAAKFNSTVTEVRVDYVQHALSAFVQYFSLLQRLEGVEPQTPVEIPPSAPPASSPKASTRKRSEEDVPPLSRAMLDASLVVGRRFLLINQTDAGNFNYEYNFITKELTPDDSEVRQAGAVWGLALIQQVIPTPDVQAAFDKAIAFFIQHSKHEGDRRWICYPGSKTGSTGTVSLLTLALVDMLRRADCPNREALTQLLKEFIQFLLSLRTPTGFFSSRYDPETGLGSGKPSP